MRERYLLLLLRAHGPGEDFEASRALLGGECRRQVANIIGEKIGLGLPEREMAFGATPERTKPSLLALLGN